MEQRQGLQDVPGAGEEVFFKESGLSQSCVDIEAGSKASEQSKIKDGDKCITVVAAGMHRSTVAVKLWC